MSKFNDKLWDTATNKAIELLELDYAQISRQSCAMPGIIVGTVVKVSRVDPPKPSFRNPSIPYINVLIEMPNGELRNINGDALVPSSKKKWVMLKSAYDKLAK